MSLDLIIGAPAWDRAWSLPIWFESVRANVNPADTGLVFVVPSTDDATRDTIAAFSVGFQWVEILRDQGPQASRQERPATEHRTLAMARNQILRVVERAAPERFLSWDTDFLVPPGAVDLVASRGLPLATVWAWLNRQPPRRMRWRRQEVLVQDPVCATAMGAVRRGSALVPAHYPPEQYLARRGRTWRAAIALAWQMMDHRAYRVACYAPHVAGEDVPFNYQLARRRVPRWCVGEVTGVHLYDRSLQEAAMGWPRVMRLAEQAPLAARGRARSPEHEALGFHPIDDGTESTEMAA